MALIKRFESPLEWFQLPRVHPTMTIVYGRVGDWQVDHIPYWGTYPDIAEHPFNWWQLPEHLASAVDAMLESLRPHRNSFQMHFEEKFGRKFQPRNVQLASQTYAKFKDTAWRWPPATRRITARDVINAWNIMCPDREVPDTSIRGLHFEPPGEQAHVGLSYLEGHGWITGLKKIWWGQAHRQARELWDELCALGLTWKGTEDPLVAMKLGRELAAKYHWIYMPTWRLDGGPMKLRRLLIGPLVMYIIETWFWWNLRWTMHDHVEAYKSRPLEIARWFAEARAGKHRLCSQDVVRYDESQSPAHIRAVYRGAQHIAGLPESLAVALWLFTCFAPTLGMAGPPQRPTVVVIHRNGQAPSGTGGFVWVNDLGNAASNYAAWNDLVKTMPPHLQEEWVPGKYKGDDGVQPLPLGVGVAKWISAFWRETGLRMDAKDTRAAKLDAKFLRRYYRVGVGCLGPIVMSRFRNAIFPEDDALERTHPALRAIRLRKQSVELMLGDAKLGIQRCHDSTLEVWEAGTRFSEHSLLDEFPLDTSLSRIYQFYKDTMSKDQILKSKKFLEDVRRSYDEGED